MKYINPYYPWFTSIGTVNNSGSEAGFINSNGWATKDIDEEVGTCMKMSFDVCFNSYYGGICLAGFTYNAVNGSSTPDAFLYLNSNYNYELRVNDNNVLTSGYKTNSGVWYHIYMEVDTANGTIAVYVDGTKIIDYSSYVTTGALPKDFKFYIHSSYVKIKNMIVTDGNLALDETVMEVALSEESAEWTKGDDGYTVTETGKSIVLKPAQTSIPGYAITGAGMLLESAIGCDNVPALNVSMGNSSTRVTLPRSSSHTVGVCFENEAGLGNITMVSAE